MVLKVSIRLPGDTVITLEASEPQLFREVLGLALRELPKDLIQMQATDIPLSRMETAVKNVIVDRKLSERPSDGPPSAQAPGESSRPTEDEESFAGFCTNLSPMGDMRRVVVAAEGASRFLGMEGVSEKELGRLFELAKWRQPVNLLQTLRNAARSKFRWLERVPGTTGYYTVTDIGRDNVVGLGKG